MYSDDFRNFTYQHMPMHNGMPMHPGMPMMPGGMPGMHGMPYPSVPSPTTMSPGAEVDAHTHGQTPAMPVVPTTPGTPTTPFIPEPPDFEYEPGAPVQTDVNYTQGYLKQQIGRYVKIEFLIGTNMLIDREGTLVDVGISYVIIREPETDDLVLCDIYSIKFVRIYY